MADSIVSCPGCGKQFRVKEGSGTGTFQCTACQAEVPYGQAPGARPARARPAKGGARGPARGPARAVPAGRRGAPAARRGAPRGRGRARRGRHADEEGGPPPKSNTGLYVGLAIGGVVVVAAVAFLLLSQGRGRQEPTPVAGGPEAGQPDAQPSPGAGQPEVAPPVEVPPSAVPGAASPGETQPLRPSGAGTDPGAGSERIDPGSSQPERQPDPSRPTRKVEVPEGSFFGADKGTLRTMSYHELAQELDHVEDTPPALRTEIDKLAATIVDFFAGRDALDAQDRLKEIGRPAIPKVLSAFLKTGDYGSREGMINACVVDQTLRSIVGDAAKLSELKQFANPDKKLIERTVKYWYIWWYTQGYTQETFDLGGDEEEEEED
jgi:hypothetical protein